MELMKVNVFMLATGSGLELMKNKISTITGAGAHIKLNCVHASNWISTGAHEREPSSCQQLIKWSL
jgi:hypothetical protein